MSHDRRTRIRTKRCPRCESLQDEANWTCDQCGFDGETTADERQKAKDEFEDWRAEHEHGHDTRLAKEVEDGND